MEPATHCKTCAAPIDRELIKRGRLCRACRSAVMRLYYQAHKAAHSQRRRQWYVANHERTIRKNREWRRAHRNQDNASKTAWKARNPSYVKEHAKVYAQKNRARIGAAKYRRCLEGKHALTDHYIAQLFGAGTALPYRAAKRMPLLLAARREQLLLARQLKEFQHVIDTVRCKA